MHCPLLFIDALSLLFPPSPLFFLGPTGRLRIGFQPDALPLSFAGDDRSIRTLVLVLARVGCNVVWLTRSRNAAPIQPFTSSCCMPILFFYKEATMCPAAELPRSSSTVKGLSKVTDFPLASLIAKSPQLPSLMLDAPLHRPV